MSFPIRILLALFVASAHAQEAPVVVASVVSQSGAYASLTESYRRGLVLWQETVNARGGLLGRRVDLRLLDDGSDAVRCGQLYAELIRAGSAQLLVGPFGSAATLMAAAEAERAHRVLINASGNLAAVQSRPHRYVFQTGVPDAAFGTAAAQFAFDAGYRSAFVLARDDEVARAMADAARSAAEQAGLRVPAVEVFSRSTQDFTPQAAAAVTAGAEAWISFGEARDAARMLQTFKKLGFTPRLFFARSAADPKLIELVGQDAEYSVGAEAYDPSFATPGNADFVKAYRARWSTPPDLGAAEAYTAGTVLAEAVRRAGSFDQEKLRAELGGLEMGTLLGGYRVDAKTGAQLAAAPVVLQIQRGKARIVWPAERREAALEPYLPWSARRLLTE